MRNIEVAVLQEPKEAERMSSFLARMTQRGHELTDMESVLDLYWKNSSFDLRQNLASLNHGTIKRFDTYTVLVVGASRRFLAQIRTHQHADFVSGSLQYSDWSEINHDTEWSNMFVVPYAFMQNITLERKYLQNCAGAYLAYKDLAKIDNDAAGFIMPNGLRNILAIHANVQEWQYMIKLRACRRNSDETRYVMLKIWDELLHTENGEQFFSPDIIGFDCQFGGCKEGKFCCGNPYQKGLEPHKIIEAEYPLCLED